jgi:FAD/FMN-containing dehydrogenase
MSVAITKSMLEEHLSAIVGPKYVSIDPKVLEKYSRDNSFVPPRMPLCVVWPGTVEEIQDVVRFAKRYKVPLVPFSTGKNNQGAAIPSVPAVVVDVSRLNKIQEVDARARVALIEPGVTFEQLQKEAEKYGLRALTPMELPASASALITLEESIPMYAWPRYETELLMTLEMVVPRTGGLLRTGMWSIEGARKPYEPGEGLLMSFSKLVLNTQGTLGIITRGFVKLKTIHEYNRVLFMPFEKLGDALMMMHRIRRLETGEELFIANKFELSLLIAKDPSQALSIRENLAPWTLVHILRGPKEEVDYQEADVKDVASELGARVLHELPSASGAPEAILDEIKSPKGWEKTSRYKGARNTIPFMTIVKRVPMYVEEVLKLAKKHGYPEEEVGFTVLPIRSGPLHCQFAFHRNPKDPEDTERVRRLYMDVGKRLIEMNAHFDKPYPLWAQMVYSRCERYHRILRVVKDAFDPDHIMNPGKLYMW